jgi:hypothetical protein
VNSVGEHDARQIGTKHCRPCAPSGRPSGSGGSMVGFLNWVLGKWAGTL